MKSLLVGLFTVAISGTTVHAASTDTVTAPIVIVTRQPVEAKVVELHMTTIEKLSEPTLKRRQKSEKLPFVRQGTCSGSFINEYGDILTAGHCVDGFDVFEVVTYDHKRYEAVVVATSSVHDLALIHIDKRNTPFFELADSLTRGETVFVLGSPLGITDTLSTGIVARLDGDLTFIDCSALPGNSGGPLFNKEQKMVGVLTAGLIVMFGTTHLNVAQGLDAVAFFIQKHIGRKL